MTLRFLHEHCSCIVCITVARAQALSKTDDPAVLTKDITARKQTVDNVCNPIINKPVPPPPKEEKKPEPAADAAPAADPYAEATAAAGATGADAGGDQSMKTDDAGAEKTPQAAPDAGAGGPVGDDAPPAADGDKMEEP